MKQRILLKSMLLIIFVVVGMLVFAYLRSQELNTSTPDAVESHGGEAAILID